MQQGTPPAAPTQPPTKVRIKAAWREPEKVADLRRCLKDCPRWEQFKKDDCEVNLIIFKGRQVTHQVVEQNESVIDAVTDCELAKRSTPPASVLIRLLGEIDEQLHLCRKADPQMRADWVELQGLWLRKILGKLRTWARRSGAKSPSQMLGAATRVRA